MRPLLSWVTSCVSGEGRTASRKLSIKFQLTGDLDGEAAWCGLLAHLVDGPAGKCSVLAALRRLHCELSPHPRLLLILIFLLLPRHHGAQDIVAAVPLPLDGLDGGVRGHGARHVDGLVVDEVGGGWGAAHWLVWPWDRQGCTSQHDPHLHNNASGDQPYWHFYD